MQIIVRYVPVSIYEYMEKNSYDNMIYIILNLFDLIILFPALT